MRYSHPFRSLTTRVVREVRVVMNTPFVLLSLTVVHLLAVASPGPDFIIVFRNSVSSQVRAGLATALGITTGNMVLLTFSILMASFLSEKNAGLFLAIKIIGALYLAWIGVKCIQGMLQAKRASSSLRSDLAKKAQKISMKAAYLMGLGTTLLNAKALMYYISIVTQFIRADQTLAMNLTMSLLLLMITLCWFSFVAQVSGSALFRTSLLRHQAKIEGVTGVVLLGFALIMISNPVFEILHSR